MPPTKPEAYGLRREARERRGDWRRRQNGQRHRAPPRHGDGGCRPETRERVPPPCAPRGRRVAPGARRPGKVPAQAGAEGSREENRRPPHGLRRPCRPRRQRRHRPAIRQRRAGRRAPDDDPRSCGRGEHHLRGGARGSRAQAEAVRAHRHRQSRRPLGLHQHVVHPDPGDRRKGPPRRPRHGVSLLQPAGRAETGRADPEPHDDGRSGGLRRSPLQEPAEDRRALRGSSRLHRQWSLHARSAARRGGGRSASGGHAVCRSGLLREPGEPGFPGPADGDLPARRLRGTRRLPVHPGRDEPAAPWREPPQPVDRSACSSKA